MAPQKRNNVECSGGRKHVAGLKLASALAPMRNGSTNIQLEIIPWFK